MRSDAPLYPTRPDLLLRCEGFFALLAAAVAYRHFYPHHWATFALLFFAPDISLLGYATAANRFAPIFYNLVHTYTLPLALGLLAWGQPSSRIGDIATAQIAIIWIAHIAFDHLLGYGLKFPGSFGLTHIQRASSPR